MLLRREMDAINASTIAFVTSQLGKYDVKKQGSLPSVTL